MKPKENQTNNSPIVILISGNRRHQMQPKKYKLSTFGETKRLVGIDENLAEPLLFGEKLFVFDENGKRIGRFSIRIDQEEGESETPKIFFVHISNRAYVNGRLSETIVTGTVSNKLKTLEEIRYEGTEIAKGKQERCMFLLRENTKYYLSVTNTVGDLKSQTRTLISFNEALGLLSESANVILLRKLAIKGYEGIICMKTVMSNGKRCRNYYVTKLSDQMVNGKKMQVLVVFRNITNHRKCNLTMTLALTRAGQLIYLFWSNSKSFIHIDPDVDVLTYCFWNKEPKLERRWHEDIQLHSLYLDKVALQKMMYRSYKYQNEALERLLADFIEHLLFMKPKDCICAAIDYFTSFGHGCKTECHAAPKRPTRTSSHTATGEEKHEEEMEEEEVEHEEINMWPGRHGQLYYGEE